EQHGSPVVGDPAGGADADRDHVVPLGQLVHAAGDRVLGAGDVARGGPADQRQHAALLVDHPRGDLGAADVDPDREPHGSSSTGISCADGDRGGGGGGGAGRVSESSTEASVPAAAVTAPATRSATSGSRSAATVRQTGHHWHSAECDSGTLRTTQSRAASTRARASSPRPPTGPGPFPGPVTCPSPRRYGFAARGGAAP